MTMTVPIGGFNRSGGVKTLVLLSNAMAQRGWTVRIIAPDYAANSPFAVAPAVSVETVATGPMPRIVRTIVYYLRLIAAAARGADVCLANFYVTAYCAWLSRFVHRRARIVYFLQGDEAESHGRQADAPAPSRWLRGTLAQASYRLPLPMFCVSEWLRQQVRRPDAIVVGQGIDLAVFHPSPRPGRSRVVIGTIANPSPVKGYPDVVRAIGTLDGAPIEFVTAAGSGETDMASFYRSCDIFVFASRREGFGLPPLEAMACGCAVITTDCGGVNDYARDAVNCLMTAPGDPNALAAAIERLIADPMLRERLAAEGVRTAAAWPRERMTERFVQSLAQVA
jgi:glycosyltransferase involved in cell wall biosynthesis